MLVVLLWNNFFIAFKAQLNLPLNGLIIENEHILSIFAFFLMFSLFPLKVCYWSTIIFTEKENIRQKKTCVSLQLFFESLYKLHFLCLLKILFPVSLILSIFHYLCYFPVIIYNFFIAILLLVNIWANTQTSCSMNIKKSSDLWSTDLCLVSFEPLPMAITSFAAWLLVSPPLQHLQLPLSSLTSNSSTVKILRCLVLTAIHCSYSHLHSSQAGSKI